MKLKLKTVLAGLLTVGALTATATGASAAIVCNRAGDCWHTHERVVYGPGYVRHPDDWYFHRAWQGDPHYRWHEWHDGRGFWRDGVWVPR
jgi:hypothetical protein